jgi:putative ABC transport system ATP-binding protein
MSMPLETQNLTRVVDSHTIVDGVSITIDAGEVVAVVGPSGAGKSSLLRLLNRLDESTAGTVQYDGKDYRAFDPQVLRKRVGFVP